jgi:transcriptional regulator HMO1
LLTDSNSQLAKSFNDCAIVLRRTAGVAEHLATVVNHVSFLSSPPEQKSQYLAVLDIANSLSALVPSPNATSAAPSNKRKAGALKEPKEKKEKAAKDPNAPKKPATAYLLYQNKVRANVKAENPEFTNKELMGKIGALWSALPDNEKQVSFSVCVSFGIPEVRFCAMISHITMPSRKPESSTRKMSVNTKRTRRVVLLP